MKHVVMYSGGVGSFITADLVQQEHGLENTILLFSDVLMEDEDLYRFNRDVEAYLGIPITVICDGRNPWQVQHDAKWATTNRYDPCSRILKREFLDRWIRANFKPDEVTCYVGIDYMEKHRIERLAPRKLPYVYKAPMVEQEFMLTNAQKLAYCRERGIEPPRLYEYGFSHNNCGGACPKAGLAQWKLLYEKMPDRYLWHEEQQEAFFVAQGGPFPFLRKTTNKVTRHLSLREYRTEILEPQQQLSLEESYDWGGCGCALDD